MRVIYIFWIAILFLLGKIVQQYYRKEITAWELVFWACFWILSGILLLVIRKIDVVAQFFGVERAIDLLVYVAIASLFYFVYRIYVKLEKIERDITKVIRNSALKNPTEEEKNR